MMLNSKRAPPTIPRHLFGCYIRPMSNFRDRIRRETRDNELWPDSVDTIQITMWEEKSIQQQKTPSSECSHKEIRDLKWKPHM